MRKQGKGNNVSFAEKCERNCNNFMFYDNKGFHYYLLIRNQIWSPFLEFEVKQENRDFEIHSLRMLRHSEIEDITSLLVLLLEKFLTPSVNVI